MSIALAKEGSTEGSTLGATLLITGCCIGAGMIGLPVVSAAAGFLPSTLAMVLCYFFATGTGLLFLEATLWFDNKVNLLTMADFAFGKGGRMITGLLFLFLFYCLFVAYIDAGGQLFASFLTHFFQFPITREAGILVCVSFVGTIVYGGTGMVSNISRLFLFGLAASYCALLTLALPHVKSEQLLHTDFKAALATLPILLVSFGYQNLIPPLTHYVRRNIQSMRKAIFIGNLIPFLIYFLWNFAILGILPDATSSLFAQMASRGAMVTGLLEKASQSGQVVIFATTFSFFGILTPFMANTMAFVDFMKDGLKLSKQSKNELLIYGMILAPPTLLTLFYPHLFLKALGLAGGFADVMLFGILPASIVWIGRYVKRVEGPYRVTGGKPFLLMILLLSAAFLLIKN